MKENPSIDLPDNKQNLIKFEKNIIHSVEAFGPARGPPGTTP